MLRCSKSSLVEKKVYRENGETRNGDTRKAQVVFIIRTPLQLVIQKPFCERLNVKLFKDKLHLYRRCSIKKVFLEASQNSQENTCAGMSLFLETFLKSDSCTGVSL